MEYLLLLKTAGLYLIVGVIIVIPLMKAYNYECRRILLAILLWWIPLIVVIVYWFDKDLHIR